MNRALLIAIASVFTVMATTVWAFEPDVNDEQELAVAKAILEIKEADPDIQRFFDDSAAYAVFPSVGKAGIGIGGALILRLLLTFLLLERRLDLGPIVGRVLQARIAPERGVVIEALQKAREAGKTRFIGYSGDNESAECAVGTGAFDTLQTSFNLVDQKALTTRRAFLVVEPQAGLLREPPEDVLDRQPLEVLVDRWRLLAGGLQRRAGRRHQVVAASGDQVVLGHAQQLEAHRVVLLEDGEQPAVEAGLDKGLLDLGNAVGEHWDSFRWTAGNLPEPTSRARDSERSSSRWSTPASLTR